MKRLKQTKNKKHLAMFRELRHAVKAAKGCLAKKVVRRLKQMKESEGQVERLEGIKKIEIDPVAYIAFLKCLHAPTADPKTLLDVDGTSVTVSEVVKGDAKALLSSNQVKNVMEGLRSWKKQKIEENRITEPEIETIEVTPKKKNRKGQRARREELMAKYGEDAEFLRKEREKELHPSWTAKLSERRGVVVGKGGKVRFDGNDGDGDTGLVLPGVEPVGVLGEEKEEMPVKKMKLHPSWKASRKQSKIVMGSGQKIVFS